MLVQLLPSKSHYRRNELKILIIEDDPMVAMIHQEFCKRISFIQKTVVANTLYQAKKIISEESFDFFLLDNYLPDGKGVDFLEENKLFPAIMVTAAKDNVTVKTALQSGIVDYLVKPFTFERFEKAMSKLQDLQQLLHYRATQEALDNYFTPLIQEVITIEELKDTLPKGLSKITLKKIVIKILELNTVFSTQQLADQLAISRISIRKYLEYLESLNCLISDAEYATKGRPAYIYQIKDVEKLKKLSD